MISFATYFLLAIVILIPSLLIFYTLQSRKRLRRQIKEYKKKQSINQKNSEEEAGTGNFSSSSSFEMNEPISHKRKLRQVLDIEEEEEKLMVIQIFDELFKPREEPKDLAHFRYTTLKQVLKDAIKHVGEEEMKTKT
jgi:hypothetical protein